jgi:hypothetical protein
MLNRAVAERWVFGGELCIVHGGKRSFERYQSFNGCRESWERVGGLSCDGVGRLLEFEVMSELRLPE